MLPVAIILLMIGPAGAQREMDNWYFGYHAGISFSNGSAQPLAGGNIFSSEGCAAVSDDSGRLLFYSDGIRIWNRNHELMNAGRLSGDTIASQSSLIARVPGSQYRYYLFTVGAVENDNGNVSYTEIDMQLNGGLGGIVAGTENTLLADNTCEKVAIIKHENCNDLWLIAHLFNSDRFLVYKIDCRGISNSPQIQALGSIVDGQVGNAIGYLKGSPDGSKIAIANFRGEVEVFDFDNRSGQISNARKIGVNNGRVCRSYGVEFSPNSRLLYVSSIYNCGDIGDYDIDQYEADAPDINASRVNIVHGLGNAPGALQLAPDNRIYIAYNNAGSLGVINNPDMNGIACDLRESAIPLPQGSKSGLGLPNAVSGYTRTLLGKDTTFCEDFYYTQQLSLQHTGIRWSTGSTDASVTVNQFGSYWVQITTADACVYSDTINIYEHNYGGPFALGNDTALCEGETLSLDVSGLGESFTWQDNSTAPAFLVTSAGIYSVRINQQGCLFSDTIDVSYKNAPQPDLGPDITVCPGQTVLLDPHTRDGSFHWENGEDYFTRTVDKEGTYSVTVENECGMGTDEVNVAWTLCPQNIPNAFTPGKNTNREFRISNGYGLTEFRMQVFNRWGELIFESRDAMLGWDGKRNGVMQPSGTYVYIVSYFTTASKRPNVYKGTVMLIL